MFDISRCFTISDTSKGGKSTRPFITNDEYIKGQMVTEKYMY